MESAGKNVRHKSQVYFRAEDKKRMPEKIKIKPNQTFKHGPKTFEKDKHYSVSEEDALYFKTNGWLGDLVGKRGKGASLDIHDSQLGHSSEVK